MNKSGLLLNYYGTHIHPETNSDLAQKALHAIIINVLLPLGPTLAITLSSRSRSIKYWFNDLLQFCDSESAIVEQYSVDLKRPVLHGKRRFVNLLLIDSFKALIDTNLVAINNNYDTPEYYFIFLKTEPSKVSAYLQQIFNYCLDNLWINCNVMIQTDAAEMLIYTYYPYLAGHCQEAVPIVINRFDGEKMVNSVNTMFPDKLANMNGCSLRMITYNVPPFVEVRQNGTISTALGFEMVIVKQMQGKLNFTLNIDVTGGFNTWFQYNISMEPFFHRLNRRKANFTVAYIRRTPILDRIVTPTFSHYYSSLVAATLQSLHKQNPIAMLGFPFPPFIWIGMLIFVMLVIFNSLYVHLKNKPITPGFRIFNFTAVQVMCGVSINKEPKTVKARLVFIWWLWFTFILRCVYQSLLFQLIRTLMYREDMHTIDSLMEGNYEGLLTYSMSKIMNETFFKRTGSMKYQFMTVSNELGLLDFLERHRKTKLFALISMDSLQYYNSEISPETKFYVLKEVIFNSQITFYFVKHSYFGERFNKAILEFEAAGLIQAWHRFSTDYKYKKWFQSDSQIIVGIQDLFGVLVLFKTMLAIAFIVFLMELLIKYLQQRRQRKLTKLRVRVVYKKISNKRVAEVSKTVNECAFK